MKALICDKCGCVHNLDDDCRNDENPVHSFELKTMGELLAEFDLCGNCLCEFLKSVRKIKEA
jgi:hypothetical protein